MNEAECWVRQVKEAETGGSEFHDKLYEWLPLCCINTLHHPLG